LYDIQEYLYNLEAIAQRCGRTGRLIQLADNLIEAYTKLEPYICFVESVSLKAKLVADVQGVLIVKNIGWGINDARSRCACTRSKKTGRQCSRSMT